MYKLIIVLFSLLPALTCAAPPDVVYRAVLEGPDFVKQTGGFLPRGSDGTRPNQPPPNISLYNHTLGSAVGLSRYDSGYVSTTLTLINAQIHINSHFAGNGYIYYIHPTGNFINVNDTLRQFSPYPSEMEYASLGMIRWQQIIGWRKVSFGIMGDYIPNRDYNHALYAQSHAGDEAPQLAGFPENHEAWGLEPWIQYAHCNQKRSSLCTPNNSAQMAGTIFYHSYWTHTMIRFLLLF